jgi:hypothetical protein
MGQLEGHTANADTRYCTAVQKSQLADLVVVEINKPLKKVTTGTLITLCTIRRARARRSFSPHRESALFLLQWRSRLILPAREDKVPG